MVSAHCVGWAPPTARALVAFGDPSPRCGPIRVTIAGACALRALVASAAKTNCAVQPASRQMAVFNIRRRPTIVRTDMSFHWIRLVVPLRGHSVDRIRLANEDTVVCRIPAQRAIRARPVNPSGSPLAPTSLARGDRPARAWPPCPGNRRDPRHPPKPEQDQQHGSSTSHRPVER